MSASLSHPSRESQAAWAGTRIEGNRTEQFRPNIQYVAKAAGMNANFLLNLGPKPDGAIQDEFITRLKEIGQWMSKYGESIYGTSGGPIGPRPWGATTQKKGVVYAHLLDWPDQALVIPRLPMPVKSAKLMGSNQAVPMKDVDNGHLLQIPMAGRDPIDTVIAIETA